MRALRGTIRPYAWGSRTVLAALLDRPEPSPGPEAELWFGAHPADPSTVEPSADAPGGSLLDVIAADPLTVLGASVSRRFGVRLPYLLKVLAAEAPLSLQAHPDAAQARAGFEAGRPDYVDPYHKPELLVAVDEFEALCGFRAPGDSADLLAALAVPALAPVVAALAGPGPDADRLRAAVTTVLSWPPADRAGVVAAVASGSGLAARLAAAYPGDIGVVVALLLNHVVLRPGQAIWMPAGNLHAYLRGTGVEIMAASDNVLRGGLTPKRVNVPELLRVLRFEVLADPLVTPVAVAPGVTTWPVPVDDFALHRIVGPATLDVPGPRVVLCLSGAATADDGTGAVPLRGGQAAFGDASGGVLSVAGEGEIYVGSPGYRA